MSKFCTACKRMHGEESKTYAVAEWISKNGAVDLLCQNHLNNWDSNAYFDPSLSGEVTLFEVV
jgi:hypothetical protein